MPTPAMSPGSTPARAMTSAMTSCVFRQISAGIVLDPTGLGENLPVLFLRGSDRQSCCVKQHAPRAGRSLINRCDKSRHEIPVSLGL
jgi:hypothetical protein